MDKNQLLHELQFKAVRSSGAGGQHVNKVASKIELIFDLKISLAFTEREKKRLLLKLENRLTKEHVLLLQCGESRSQHRNKELVIKRLFAIFENALKVPKKRRKTRRTRSSIEKRLKSKKIAARKKANRGKPVIE